MIIDILPSLETNGIVILMVRGQKFQVRWYFNRTYRWLFLNFVQRFIPRLYEDRSPTYTFSRLEIFWLNLIIDKFIYVAISPHQVFALVVNVVIVFILITNHTFQTIVLFKAF